MTPDPFIERALDKAVSDKQDFDWRIDRLIGTLGNIANQYCPPHPDTPASAVCNDNAQDLFKIFTDLAYIVDWLSHEGTDYGPVDPIMEYTSLPDIGEIRDELERYITKTIPVIEIEEGEDE